MQVGLLLSGTAQDIANLTVLLNLHPELASAPWVQVGLKEGKAIAPMLEKEKARTRILSDLKKAGLPLVSMPQGDARVAPNLVRALPLLPQPGDPLVQEALFWMDAQGPAPRLILERLLLLGRDDVAIIEWEDQGAHRFCVQVSQPPLYLMMLANDQSREGVQVFYKAPQTQALWIEWGYAHPLPKVADRSLLDADQTAFVDRSGRWRCAPSSWSQRSIYDAIQPKLNAPEQHLSPLQGQERFSIHLRLAPAEVHDPQLWLLTPDQLFELEPFVEQASAEELRKLLVSRLCTQAAPGRAPSVLYLLRERAGGQRLGARLMSLLEAPGYTKVTGIENLYVPVGRRLVPPVRRDELRKLLELDEAKLVIIAEDRDGPRRFIVRDLIDGSLFDWVEYIATDRRVALDRSMERSVFDMPAMQVEQPKAERPKLTVRPPQPKPRTFEVKRERPEPAALVKAAPEPAQAEGSENLLALREKAKPLEALISPGGHTEPQTWHELGHIKAQLSELDEACACLESALFYAKPAEQRTIARALLSHRAQQLSKPPDALSDMLLKDSFTATEAAYLGARLAERILSSAPPSDELVQVALQLYTKGDLPTSRRLTWCFLRAWHNHANDPLGLTRAKETLLGQLNVEGLSQMYDLPRFVRLSLALEDSDDAPALDSSRAEQLSALESLWAPLEEHLEEFDAQANFTRLIFAVGYMRLGAAARAKDIVQPVEHELPAHDVPNQLLFRLYLSRMAFEATEGDQEAWLKEADQVLTGVSDQQRRPAAWLRERSLWLAPPKQVREVELPEKVLRLIEPYEEALESLPQMFSELKRRWPSLYDYQVAAIIERALRAALASGNEALISEVLEAVEPLLSAMKILGHRVKTIGACIKAAQTIEEKPRVERLLGEVVRIAGQDDVPWVRELLVAVQPGLSALRRHGAHEAAARLLQALEPIPVRTFSEQIMLKAALAGGFLQVKESQKATQLVDEALAQVFDPQLDYVGRYEGGALTLDVLRHWPTDARLLRYQRVVEGLSAFRDAFTTGQYFKAHKILILEHVVDAMADSQTQRSDRVQSFLDAEEYAVRRRIISDWSELCGR